MTKILKYIILNYYIFYFATIAFPQAYTFYHYGIRHGISSSDVSDIIQDKNGVMWFTTSSGISSYNGYSWTNYRDFPELKTPPAFIKLEKDNLGNLYAVTTYLEHGFCIFKMENGNWIKVTALKLEVDNFIEKKEITLDSIVINKNNSQLEIAIGLNGIGIAVYHDEMWSLTKKINNKPLTIVNGILKFKKVYIVATNIGLFEMELQNNLTPKFNSLPLMKGEEIKSICIEDSSFAPDLKLKEDRIWVMCEHFIGYFHNINDKYLIYKYNFKENFSDTNTKITPDYYGGIFISSSNKLLYFDYTKNTIVLQNYENGFFTNTVKNIFIDFERNAWFASSYGIDKLISRAFTNYSTKQGLLGDGVTSILEYSKNKKILGHRFGVTFMENNKVSKTIVFEKLLKYQKERILDIAIDNKENFWFACGTAGLIKLDKKGKVSQISEVYASSVELLNSGEIAVSSKSTLFKIKNNSMIRFCEKTKLFGFIRNLFQFDTDDIYYTTNKNGIYIIKKCGKIINISSKDTRLKNVYYIIKNNEGEFLLGTLGGLCTIKNNEIVPYETKNKMFSKPVYSIAKINENNFWLGTNQGVYKWDNGDNKLYSRNLGLIGEDVSRNAFLIDKKGDFFVGTNHGLNVYNKKYDSNFAYNIKPKLKILSFQTNANTIEVDYNNNPIVLNSEDFEVKLEMISFINETLNQFSYKVEGNGKDWEKITYPFKPQINIPSLPSGKYKLLIKGTNANGIESTIIESPELIIKRSMQFSKIIKFLAAIILFLGGWILFYGYFTRKNKENLEKHIQERIKEINQAEVKYLELFEGTFDGIFYVNLDGKFLDINKACLTILGYKSKEEALNSGGIRSHYVDLNEREKILKKVYEDGHVNNFDLDIRTTKKERKKISMSAILFKDDNNNPTGFRAIIKDITEKEELKEKLARSEKMEAIGLLAGGVAHDLNNILAGLTTYPEILLMKIEKDSPLRKNIEIIKKSGDKAAAMVQDLLTMARRGIKTKDVLNVNMIIKEYFESPEFEKVKSNHKNVTYEIQKDDDISNIKGSKIHMLKCLMNLVSNASEAINKEGKVIVKTYKCDIEAKKTNHGIIPKGNYVVIEVSDNGTGMSTQDINHIFEPFYTKKVMGKSGTGLGMGVVWSTVKDSEGFIDVSSTEGSGSCIKLYFPTCDYIEIIEKESIDMSGLRGNESLLVVDDIEEQRDGAKIILNHLGYNVFTVSSGEKCIEFLELKKVDLILLDMIMDPGINGVETYKKIKLINSKQKVIIVSGFAEGEQIETIKSLGINTIVKKPYAIKELGFAVRNELNNSLHLNQ